MVISADDEHDPDVLAITGASAALYLSDIPFTTPIAGVRVGLVDGKYVVNPTYEQLRQSKLNLIVAASEEAIVMVEAGAGGRRAGHARSSPLCARRGAKALRPAALDV
jgi:polyribonucleotide nucleotidyltransferase